VPKSSWAISRVNAELKSNVSENPSVSIIRVDVANGHISLIFIQLYKTVAFQGDSQNVGFFQH
jgi:hypothetical protein